MWSFASAVENIFHMISGILFYVGVFFSFFCTITEPYGYSVRTSGCDAVCLPNHLCELLSDCLLGFLYGNWKLTLSGKDGEQELFSAVAGKSFEQPADNYLMTSLALPSACVTISL